MIRRFGRLPFTREKQSAFNADRLVNRFWDYPRHLGSRLGEFDCFHICDHSYAHLIHELPAVRTGVYCHDLDTFRCLLEPKKEPRPAWFRAMSWRILRGLRQAAIVFCSTLVTKELILKHGLVEPAKLIHAPYGIAAEFSPDPDIKNDQAFLHENSCRSPYLLHVGSCIPRKRMDVLLEVFASLRDIQPNLMLVQAGGRWTPAQRELIDRHGLGQAVRQIAELDRQALAALYRHSALVLLPSEAEGFGLPMIEALACGAIVVASDIPMLHEVGGQAVIYTPVADINNWVEVCNRLLDDPDAAPNRTIRINQARGYSWAKHADIILGAYEHLCC
jgi:glycosyltransferase involved in cell wall biosynthesis